MKEKIQVYCPNNAKIKFEEFLVDASVSCNHKIREKQGFSKFDIVPPHFYGEKYSPIVQADIYIKTENNSNSYVFEIWDANRMIIQFLCKNDLDFFHLLERFISMKHKALECEKITMLLMEKNELERSKN